VRESFYVKFDEWIYVILDPELPGAYDYVASSFWVENCSDAYGTLC
jgi:hypothetical protein